FIDVYGIDKEGRIVVVELKRKTAGKEAALQLAKYVDSLKNTANREIRGVLVAPQIAKGVQKLLVTLELDFKQLDPKKCAKILRERETKKLFDFY
ncbi:MAG: endonuclease NucS, partial [Candidatus Bathyarchaeota archaeon]|nr:endonuclease NucS [Candidatus Bathyarchaeota archaeon]